MLFQAKCKAKLEFLEAGKNQKCFTWYQKGTDVSLENTMLKNKKLVLYNNTKGFIKSGRISNMLMVRFY